MVFRNTRALLSVAAIACGALLSASAAASAEPLLRHEGAFGSFASPTGIATDAGGRVYVADAGAGRVEVFDAASDGNRPLGTIGVGELVRPVGVAVDNRGRIYVVDSARGLVVRYTSWVDGAEKSREIGAGGGTALGQLGDPRFLVPDTESRIYVVEHENARVQWLSVGGDPIAAFGVSDPAPFDQPEGIARERSGVLYVTNASPSAGALRYYDRRGMLLGEIAGPGSGPGQLSAPRGLVRDPVGRLVVADSGNDRVQVLSPPGYGGAIDAYSGAGSAALARPAGVALAPGATLYVTDAGNGRVVRLSYDDADQDGAIDAQDTCAGLANPDQRDTDRDGNGDACDQDDDNDGVADTADLCPRSARGPDANRDGCGDPQSRITVPGASVTTRRRPPRRIAGTADADALGVARVQVAVAQRVGGSRCRWWTGGRFGRATSCAAHAWTTARGRDDWSLRVRLPRRAAYRVLSRALQAGGAVEVKRGAGNTRFFRLR